MDFKSLMIVRVRQLIQEQANTKDYCHRHFGGFSGEVVVPANFEFLPDAQLLEVFEQLVAAKAVRGSSPTCMAS